MAAPSRAVPESEKQRKLTCLLHIFMKETSKVTPFTVVSWKKACECAERWKDLEDCIEKQISVEHADMWAQSRVDVMKGSYGYHRNCYSHFTNTTNIARAAKRYRQVEGQCSAEATGGMTRSIPTSSTRKKVTPTPSTSTRTLRSAEPPLALVSHTAPPRVKHVLPDICIVCKKKDIFMTSGRSRRIRDKLVQAETVDAGKYETVFLYFPLVYKVGDGFVGGFINFIHGLSRLFMGIT